MLSAFTAKISLYLKIGLLVIIIICIVFIGIQYVRIKALEKNVDDLKIENELLAKDKKFFEARIKILSDFTNSNMAIVNITNEVIFTSNKQFAIDSIIEDFYR